MRCGFGSTEIREALRTAWDDSLASEDEFD
jgi:hypothetical protein